MIKTTDYQQLLALDVGHKRVGVARAHSLARLVEPVQIIQMDGGEFTTLTDLFQAHQPDILVVGLPLNQQGLAGQQAQIIKDWTNKMITITNFQGKLVYWDETLSSVVAKNQNPQADAVDDLAACVILEDYLSHTEQ